MNHVIVSVAYGKISFENNIQGHIVLIHQSQMQNTSCNFTGITIFLQLIMNQLDMNVMQGVSGIGLSQILTNTEYMFNVYQTINGNQWIGQLVKMV